MVIVKAYFKRCFPIYRQPIPYVVLKVINFLAHLESSQSEHCNLREVILTVLVNLNYTIQHS